MAKAKEFKYKANTNKRTEIGGSRWSRPINKHKRRNWKKYRGHGR